MVALADGRAEQAAEKTSPRVEIARSQTEERKKERKRKEVFLSWGRMRAARP